MEAATLTGEYYLTGVREMASGFLIQPDNTFQFFFAYGALDRMGSGTWSVKGDSIFLTSAAWSGKDFSLAKSSKTDNDFINIVIDHTNPMLIRHTYCSLQNGAAETWTPFDQRGDVQFPLQEVNTLALQFEFCPERFSVIPVDEKNHNEFLLRVEPSLVEVFLENFSLQINGTALIGRHPILEGKEFRYEKQ